MKYYSLSSQAHLLSWMLICLGNRVFLKSHTRIAQQEIEQRGVKPSQLYN